MNPSDAARESRYVIQHHTGYRRDHYDLMLQRGGILWTWQIDRPPAPAEAGPIDALRIGDHRLDYLAYEGPISGGRGQCRIADVGRVAWLAVGDERIEVELLDGACRGRYELCLADAGESRWQLRPAPG